MSFQPELRGEDFLALLALPVFDAGMSEAVDLKSLGCQESYSALGTLMFLLRIWIFLRNFDLVLQLLLERRDRQFVVFIRRWVDRCALLSCVILDELFSLLSCSSRLIFRFCIYKKFNSMKSKINFINSL